MIEDAPLLHSPSIAPRDMMSILQTALIDSSQSNARILGCTLLDHRQRDGQRGATQYNVELSGPEGGKGYWQLVSALSLGGPRTRRLLRQLQESDLPDVIPETGLKPFAYDADLDILFQVFPFDARLPTLRHLVPSPSPEISAALNDDMLSRQRTHGSWHGEMVRYRPDMRATVRLALMSEDGLARTPSVQYFAKVYRDPDQALRTNGIHQSLLRELKLGASTFDVSRPLDLSPSLNTVLTTAVAGMPLDRALKRSPDAAPELRAAARAIASLHQLQISAPERPVAEEAAKIRQSGETVIRTFPALEERVNAILDFTASGFTDRPTAFVHGDLKPEHVLVDDGGRVAIIDFDLAVAGDPMIDIAHFMAFLEKSASRSRAGVKQNANPISVFLDEYFTHAPSDGLPRLGLYHAGTAVHKAAGLCRHPSADSSRQAEELLDEGLLFAAGEIDVSRPPSFKRRMTRTA